MMLKQLEAEFRSRTYLMEELFDIHPIPDAGILVRDCFIIKNKHAKYYNESNNNMQPTRFDLAIVPKYDRWEDAPDALNIVTYRQVMGFFLAMVNHAIEEYLGSVAVSSTFTDVEVFGKIKIQASVSLIDSTKLDSVHMANMYRHYEAQLSEKP